MAQISNLPQELIELILDHLLLPDLAQAMLVCRGWRELADHQPARWKDFQYVVHQKNYGNVEVILTCKRFSQVKKLKLVDTFLNGDEILNIRSEKVKNSCFKLIWQLPTLESLDLSDFNKGCIDPHVLSVFPPKLETLVIDGEWESVKNITGLTGVQASFLFTGMMDQDTLRELRIPELELDGVDPLVVATVVNKLERLEIREPECEYIEAIFGHMANESRLKEVEFHQLDLWNSYMDADILAIAVNKLEYAHFYAVMMHKDQLEKILRQTLVETKLKELVIGFWSKMDKVIAVRRIPDDLIKAVEQKLDQFVISS
jgi:hypothetical protein